MARVRKFLKERIKDNLDELILKTTSVSFLWCSWKDYSEKGKAEKQAEEHEKKEALDSQRHQENRELLQEIHLTTLYKAEMGCQSRPWWHFWSHRPSVPYAEWRLNKLEKIRAEQKLREKQDQAPAAVKEPETEWVPEPIDMII